MNQAQTKRLVHDNLHLLRQSNRTSTHYGCVRIHHNTDQHEDTKYFITKFLVRAGHKVITEAIFEDPFSGRADIFVLDKNIIIEVLKSEKIEDCKEKVKKYPPHLQVITVTPETWKKELAFLA